MSYKNEIIVFTNKKKNYNFHKNEVPLFSSILSKSIPVRGLFVFFISLAGEELPREAACT